MVQEEEENPHAGGTGGASSRPDSRDAGAADTENAGTGDIEIPIGVPVSEEDFRRLKDQARHPVRSGDEDAADQAQENNGSHDGP